MTRKKTVLVCKRVTFYSQTDEDAFFESIKKMSFVEKAWGDRNKLYLALATYDLDECHIANLHALFRRYKIDLNLLKDFLRKANNAMLGELV